VINLDLRADPERFAGGDAVRLDARVLAAIEAGDEAGARGGIGEDIGKAAEVILARGGLPD
jgi:hypothetical protein